MTTTNKLNGAYVMLSTEHGDLGIFTAEAGAKRARAEAKALKTAVYLRDANTDEVLWVEQPK
jgi:hypothetical protein